MIFYLPIRIKVIQRVRVSMERGCSQMKKREKSMRGNLKKQWENLMLFNNRKLLINLQ